VDELAGHPFADEVVGERGLEHHPHSAVAGADQARLPVDTHVHLRAFQHHLLAAPKPQAEGLARRGLLHQRLATLPQRFDDRGDTAAELGAHEIEPGADLQPAERAVG